MDEKKILNKLNITTRTQSYGQGPAGTLTIGFEPFASMKWLT